MKLLNNGIVIRQSLKNEDLTPIQDLVVETYPYKMDGIELVEIAKLNIRTEQVLDVNFLIAGLLKTEKFYAHIVNQQTLWVIYPSCTFMIDRNSSPKLFDRCREVGNLYHIPSKQMQFEKLFLKDHPNG